MFRKALLIVLIAIMATLPSLASACALKCAVDQAAGMTQHAPAHCQGAADGSNGPASDSSPDIGMTALCAFAATGAISVAPFIVSASASPSVVAYTATPTLSEIAAPPDEPPRG
jgi:hypothetical protein